MYSEHLNIQRLHLNEDRRHNVFGKRRRPLWSCCQIVLCDTMHDWPDSKTIGWVKNTMRRHRRNHAKRNQGGWGTFTCIYGLHVDQLKQVLRLGTLIYLYCSSRNCFLVNVRIVVLDTLLELLNSNLRLRWKEKSCARIRHFFLLNLDSSDFPFRLHKPYRVCVHVTIKCKLRDELYIV